MRLPLLSVVLFGLVAGGCQYEFRSAQDQPVLMAERGEVKTLYVCDVREYLYWFNADEASSYGDSFLLEQRPPEAGVDLRSKIVALPRYRRLESDLRTVSLMTAVDAVWAAADPNFRLGDKLPETTMAYVISADPFVLAIGPVEADNQGMRREWGFLSRKDMFDLPVTRIAVVTQPWETIERRWRASKWYDRDTVVTPVLEVREFDPPITVGATFRLEPWQWATTKSAANQKAE